MIAEVCEYGVGVPELVALLDKRGAVCITGLIQQKWLDWARADVTSRLKRGNQSSQYVFNPAAVSGSAAHHLADDQSVRDLLTGLAAARLRPTADPHAAIDSALNIFAGPSQDRRTPSFHYDAHTVTMVVPLFMPDPDEGSTGQLVIFPNRRPFRSSVLVNIVEKAMTQNRLRSARTLRRIRQDRDDHILDMQPGNAYLFWGYRTYHGTLPSASSELRATLLLHCGAPHGDSRLLAAAKWIRRRTKPLPPQHYMFDTPQH